MPAAGSSNAPIALSDSDSDAEFFTKKKKAKPSVIVPVFEDEDAGADTDESDVEGKSSPKKTKKRARPKPNPKNLLPEWTRTGHVSTHGERRSGSAAGRSSREKSERHTIEVSSGDEHGAGPSRRKEKLKQKRQRAELTPPPKLSEARIAELRNVVDQHLAETYPVEVDDDPDTPHAKGSGETVEIHVRMVADLENMPAGASKNAISAYEKRRTMTIYKDASMENVFDTLADRVGKLAEDLVLVHKGRRIISMLTTPRTLRLENGSEIEGYEKSFYDRLERKRQEERNRLLNTEPSPELEAMPPSSEKKKLTRVILRGGWGEIKLKVEDFVQAKALLEKYCTRHGKSENMVKKLKLSFDGDTLSPSATVGAMGVEDDDMLDVIIP